MGGPEERKMIHSVSLILFVPFCIFHYTKGSHVDNNVTISMYAGANCHVLLLTYISICYYPVLVSGWMVSWSVSSAFMMLLVSNLQATFSFYYDVS